MPLPGSAMRRSALLAAVGLLLLLSPPLRAADIPADAAGLPHWVPRVWTDFPVRIELADQAALAALLARVPVASFDREQLSRVRAGETTVRLVWQPRVTEEEAAALAAAGAEFERLRDVDREAREAAEAVWAAQAAKGGEVLKSGEAGVYHTQAQIGAILQQAQVDHPALAAYYSLGNSVLGRPLHAIVISDNVGVEEAEPEVRLTANIHGDETVQMENLVALVEHLTNNYGTDPVVTDLVDNTEIHVVPSLNPDGNAALTRTNANGEDLNRDYPVPDGTIGDDGDWTLEPETVLVHNHAAARNFVISEVGHGGALVVNYLWDHTYTLAPDNDGIVELALEYSLYNPPMYASTIFLLGITNGADWYLVKGTVQDWAYHETGCWDFTIEVSTVKNPDASTLEQYWLDNKESLLHFIKAARYGVHGRVTSSVTGLPLAATVAVTGISKTVRTDPDFGDYYKILPAGAWDLTFSADGYASRTFAGVSTVWGAGTPLDVQLTPAEEADLAVDTFEDGPDGWTGGWALTTALSHSPSTSLTDSPDDSYANNATDVATRAALDLSAACAGTVSFWARWDLELNRDGVFFEISADGGATWLALATAYTQPASGQGSQLPAGTPLFEGTQTAWVENSADLGPFLGEPDVRFRFRLQSDNFRTYDGFYVDDFVVHVARPLVVGAGDTPAVARRLTAAPNPFNPRTELRFVLARAGVARLTIHDLSGRRVRALLDAELTAGEQIVPWDGRDDRGAPLPSAAYFARLAVGAQKWTVKVMLLK